MKQYIVVAGCNGSGKTTLCYSLITSNDLAFVNIDLISKDLVLKNPLLKGEDTKVFFEAGKKALKLITVLFINK